MTKYKLSNFDIFFLCLFLCTLVTFIGFVPWMYIIEKQFIVLFILASAGLFLHYHKAKNRDMIIMPITVYIIFLTVLGINSLFYSPIHDRKFYGLKVYAIKERNSSWSNGTTVELMQYSFIFSPKVLDSEFYHHGYEFPPDCKLKIVKTKMQQSMTKPCLPNCFYIRCSKHQDYLDQVRAID